MGTDVVVNLGTAIATIGVMVALYVRVDRRIDRLDAKFDGLARDVVDVKVSVARIEGYLESRDGFTPRRQGPRRFLTVCRAKHKAAPDGYHPSRTRSRSFQVIATRQVGRG